MEQHTLIGLDQVIVISVGAFEMQVSRIRGVLNL